VGSTKTVNSVKRKGNKTKQKKQKQKPKACEVDEERKPNTMKKTNKHKKPYPPKQNRKENE